MPKRNGFDFRTGAFWAVYLSSGLGFVFGFRLLTEHLTGGAIPFLFLGLAGLGLFVYHMGEALARSRAYWRDWQSRPSQSDEEFLQGCEIPAESPQAALALCVRRAMAEAAGVRLTTIHSTDSMQDSIWDSVDMLDIWFRVEKSAGVKLKRNWMDAGRGKTEDPLEIYVSHLVRSITESAVPLVYSKQRRTANGQDRNPRGKDLRRP